MRNQMATLTYKDLQIICQSQTQRAIELCTLCGFPEDKTTPQAKMTYIMTQLTPWLVKQQLLNVDKLIDYYENKGKKE
jgi:hypothetical protein